MSRVAAITFGLSSAASAEFRTRGRTTLTAERRSGSYRVGLLAAASASTFPFTFNRND